MASFSDIFADKNNGQENHNRQEHNDNPIESRDIEKYVTKVIQTLFFQFLFTFSCVTIVAFSTYVRMFCILNALPIFGLSFIGGFITVLCMFMSSVKTNLQLSIFTIFETMLVCVGSCIYSTEVVLTSVIVTMCVTFGLGMYALSTNYNHMNPESLLSCGLSFLLFVLCWNLFLGNSLLHIIGIFFGTLLFFGYIVYDVQYFLKERIANTKDRSQNIPEDLHIDAALNIYLDVINVFIRVLEIVDIIIGKKNNSSR